MTTYTVAFAGERLDRIAKKVLQTEHQGAVEALLDANAELADLAASGFVPGGTVITIPSSFNPAPQAAQVLAWE